MALIYEESLKDSLATLYLEAHVTIEPVFDDDLEKVEEICAAHGFKIASLLMKKRIEDTEERSKYDTFMTAHDKSLNNIKNKVKNLVESLISQGIKVWRYKIEDTVLDSRTNDELGLLK